MDFIRLGGGIGSHCANGMAMSRCLKENLAVLDLRGGGKYRRTAGDEREGLLGSWVRGFV